MEAAAIADAKRDRTFEEFEEQYLDHISGKIDPALRVGNRPVTAGYDGTGDMEGVSAAGMGAKRQSIEKSEQMDATSSKRERSISKGDRSQASRSVKNKSSMSQRSRATGGSEKIEQKYDISKECKLQLLTNLKIEELDDNFVLAAAPYPQMEGELLIFQLNEKDKEEPDEDGKEKK